MQILFRVDASAEIGTGHVMRCLTLADRLRKQGARVSFICRAHHAHLREFIEGHGYPVVMLPMPQAVPEADRWLGADWETDAMETGAAITGLGITPGWLVVDHYRIDQRWEQVLRSQVGHIMVIDDLADRPHDCDLLLDQNFNPDPHRYAPLLPKSCQTVLGPRYALLRPEFAAARESLRERGARCRNILVFFGGADAGNETGKVLDALQQPALNGLRVEVIIGPINPNRDALLQQIAAMDHVYPHETVSDMAGMMVTADLAIGAGGATQWERCCLGLPTLAISVAANQTAILQHLSAAGLLIYLGESASVTAQHIAGALTTLTTTPGLLPRLSQAVLEQVDGRGAERVCAAMATDQLTLRLAQPDDCMDLLAWRNAEQVRRHAFDSAPISASAHRAWFGKVMADPNRVLWIGECNRQPVGVVRYDMDGQEAEVSIYLLPGQAGAGIGPRLLTAANRQLVAEHPAIRRVIGQVLSSNTASLRAFEKAGFNTFANTMQWETGHE